MSLAVRSVLLAGLLLAGSAVANQAQAAVTPVPVGQPLARFDNLKPGAHRYLRFKQTGDTVRVADVWTREVRFEDQDGQRRLGGLRPGHAAVPGPAAGAARLQPDHGGPAGRVAVPAGGRDPADGGFEGSAAPAGRPAADAALVVAGVESRMPTPCVVLVLRQAQDEVSNAAFPSSLS